MQSKGAGPVNRVELESQVLCAALRQSSHNKDRIGAFTSVRELSHLFPDLLPPPEKHDDAANGNKANYYNVLGLKPQSSANSVVAAYLRTVRTFLKTQKVAEARIEYNKILNAGFILRKPRLRLSHDIVVARRWLHEESRLAQMAVQEVTQDRMEAIKTIREASSTPVGSVPAVPPMEPALEMPKAAEPAPAPVSAPAATSVPPMPPLPSMSPAPNTVPEGMPPNAVPPVPPLPMVAQSGSEGFASGVPVPPVPPLPVNTTQPPVVPPMPAAVSEIWEKQQAATAIEPPAVATVPPMPPLPNMNASAEVAVKDAPSSVLTEPVATYEPPEVYTPPPDVFGGDDEDVAASAAGEAAPEVAAAHTNGDAEAAAAAAAAHAEPALDEPAHMEVADDATPAVSFTALPPPIDVAPSSKPGPSNDAEFFAAIGAGVGDMVPEAAPPAEVAPEHAPVEMPAVAEPVAEYVETPSAEEAAAAEYAAPEYSAPAAEYAAPEYSAPAVEAAPTPEYAAPEADAAPAPAAQRDDDLIEVAPGVFVPASALAEEAKAMEASQQAVPSVVNEAVAAAQAAAAEAAAVQAAAEAAAIAAAARAAAEAAAAQAAAAEAAAKAAAAEAAAKAAAQQAAAQQAAAQAAAAQAAAANQQVAAAATPPAPSPAPAPAPAPAPEPAPAATSSGFNTSPEFDFPPAAVRAQQMPPAEPPAPRSSGRISNEAAFVFDESALAPPPAQQKKVPMLIQLLEAAQFITPVEVQAILAQMAFAPNVPVEKLILNAGYVQESELASVKLGESLLQSGKINMAQFQVAIYDERTSGLRMAESLQVRGWLSVEVRNAIDEFHKKRS